MYLVRKNFACALVAAILLSASATARQISQSDSDFPDLSDLGSKIQDEVNKSMEEMKKNCGADATAQINNLCYGKCDGAQTINDSDCTCNGKPCATWKVGETGPSASSEVATGATDVADGVAAGATEAATTVASGAKEAGTTVASGAEEAATTVASGAEDAATAVASGATDIASNPSSAKATTVLVAAVACLLATIA